MAVCNSALVDIQTDLKSIFLDKKVENFYEEYYGKDGKSDFHFKDAKHYSNPTKNIQDISLEHSSCIECGHPIKALDMHHGEVICEGCGLVNDSFKIISHEFDMTETDFKEAHVKLTESGRHIQRILKEDDDTDKKDWRKHQHYITVDIISSYYMMTDYQKQRTNEFIDKYSLKHVHSRLNDKAIILGICIYFQKKEGRHILIHNNNYCKSYGLNKHSYDVISKNISKLLEY